MSLFWAVNGTNLLFDNVELKPTRAVVEQEVRQSLTAIHGGGQDRQKTGRNKPRITLEIVFLGDDIEKFEQAAWLTDILDQHDVWSLEAPSWAPMYLYKLGRRIALSTVTWNQDPQDAHGRITLSITAIVEGIWIADDGAFAQCFGGTMTRNSSTSYTQTPATSPNGASLTGEGDFGYGDSAGPFTDPYITLPAQTSGYPLAQRASDHAMVQLTQVGTYSTLNEDGVTIFYGIYDLTGFLHPSNLAADGDVGVFRVCSSPNRAFLGGTDNAVGAGLAGSPVASFMVGEA